MTRSEFLLVTQHALIGQITPNVRSASGDVSSSTITLRYITDGPLSEDDQERLSCVSTEIIAATLSPWMLDEQFVRIDAPMPLLAHELPYIAYRRHEPT